MEHPQLGNICYLCNLDPIKEGAKIVPTDLYKRRIYLEPLGLMLSMDAGTFESIVFSKKKKTVEITFLSASKENYAYPERRLRVEKQANEGLRPGSAFTLSPSSVLRRGAFILPLGQITVTISYTE